MDLHGQRRKLERLAGPHVGGCGGSRLGQVRLALRAGRVRRHGRLRLCGHAAMGAHVSVGANSDERGGQLCRGHRPRVHGGRGEASRRKRIGVGDSGGRRLRHRNRRRWDPVGVHGAWRTAGARSRSLRSELDDSNEGHLRLRRFLHRGGLQYRQEHPPQQSRAELRARPGGVRASALRLATATPRPVQGRLERG